MIPLKLNMVNFLSYRGVAPTLDLEGVHVACLTGNNGHGKSAILDAITWVLWGTARASSQEELICHDEPEMMVELEFLARDGRYRVSRKFSRARGGRQGATLLELLEITSSGIIPLTGNSIHETRNRIRSLLHMDYDTFINSSFIMQGKADMFTTSTPSRRKEILGEILNLSWYERLAEKARTESRERDSSLKLLEIMIGNIDEDLSHKHELEDRYATIDSDMSSLIEYITGSESKLEALQLQVRRFETQSQELENLKKEEQHVGQDVLHRESRVEKQIVRISDLDSQVEGLPALELELESVQNRLGQFTESEDVLLQMRLKMHDLDSYASALENSNMKLKAEMEELRVKVDLLDEADSSGTAKVTCPLCGQELGEQGCSDLAIMYEGEGKQKADLHRKNEKDIRVYHAEIIDIKMEMEQAEGTFALEKQAHEHKRDSLIQSIESVKASHKLIGELRLVLDGEQTTLTASLNRLSDLRCSIEQLSSDLPSVERITDDRDKETDRLANLRSKQNGLLEERGIVQGQLTRMDVLEQERKDKVIAFSDLSRDKGLFDQLSVAFGKGGIQALLIESAIPELEKQSNDILGRITDHRMRMELETQRERRGGGDPMETLDIKIADELGLRAYETYSGGEAFRVNFALRIALSKLLAHRSGSPLPTLFIDEGFGTQDSYGLERLIEAISVIKNEFRKIIVITHIDDLKDVFDVRIEVTKSIDGSTFVVN